MPWKNVFIHWNKKGLTQRKSKKGQTRRIAICREIMLETKKNAILIKLCDYPYFYPYVYPH